MNGQWLGKYEGTNQGLMVANLDDMGSFYQGVVYLNEDDPSKPSTAAWVKTLDKSTTFNLEHVHLSPINPSNGLTDHWQNVQHWYPNVTFPNYANVVGRLDGGILNFQWSTDIGTNGVSTLLKSQADKPSNIQPLVKNWNEFKSYVAALNGRRFLFRGQSHGWRLRTAFHRTERADLHRFINEDIQTLHKRLSARTKHIFNLEIPNENGAFLNLLQHHGYPTPLLDWSYSPYVAAFFAYRNISNQEVARANESDHVRIYVFDQLQWREDFLQLYHLSPASLHLSIGEFIAIENERLIPQQAASTVTNIDDVETYVLRRQTPEKQYLMAIDLPIKDVDKVNQELGFMGITAGSLFPGLDGVCEEIKVRNFKL
jgi:FRG domain